MSVVRIELGCKPIDGQHVTFKAPCDCTAITGIRVYYQDGEQKKSTSFTMKDTHGNDLTGIGNLFMTGAYVHVILDTNSGTAYLQNADTNGYLEGKMDDHKHSASDITSGTLGVARGGTGATTFTSGAALIGNGTGAVTTRAITNNTVTGVCTGTNLATNNTVDYHVRARMNRENSVHVANSGYTYYITRGIALVTSVPSSLTNGCVAFVYS